LTYEALERGWKAMRRQGLRVREVACEGVARTLICAEAGSYERPAIHIAAGVHGDEPAAPWALLSIAADGLLDTQTFSFRLWACTNPSGYRLGTRENAEGRDINRSFSRGGKTPEARAMIVANRDRKFVLSIDLHEDFETEGFYCYEPIVNGSAMFGKRIIEALDDAALPVERIDEGFDLAYPPGVPLPPIERGHVMPDVHVEASFGDERPLNPFMLRGAARRVLTFESPRRQPWETRIAIHRVALTTAITYLARQAYAAPNVKVH